jgi:acyl-CoA synthetase (AMP-forming)/AMP-acid ligase II
VSTVQPGWLRTGDLVVIDEEGQLFVDAIPRTPAGKILRRVLVEHERQAV